MTMTRHEGGVVLANMTHLNLLHLPRIRTADNYSGTPITSVVVPRNYYNGQVVPAVKAGLFVGEG